MNSDLAMAFAFAAAFNGKRYGRRAETPEVGKHHRAGAKKKARRKMAQASKRRNRK